MKRLKKNAKLPIILIANIIFKFLAVGIGFYTSYWLNKNLSPTELKDYNLIVASYSPLILTVIDFGIVALIQKYYTNHKNKEKLANAWTTFNFLRILSYFLGLVLILFTFPLSKVDDLGLIFLLFSAQFILIFDHNYAAVCNAKGRTWQFSLVDFLTKFLLFLFLIAFKPIINSELSGVIYFGIVAIISYSAGMIMDAIWQRRLTKFGKIDFSLIKENLKPMGLLTLAGISTALYLTTDKMFLAHFGEDEFTINGYSDAYKLLEIAVIASGITMPYLATLAKKEFTRMKADIKKIFWKWSLVSLILGIVSFAGLVLVGPYIIGLIQQEVEYPDAYKALPILSGALVVVYLNVLYKNLLIFLNKEKYEFITNLITAIVTISLYFILIPKIGFYGAAIASLVSYTTALAGKFFFLTKTLFKDKKTES